MTPAKGYISRKELAKKLGVKPATLARRDRLGEGPAGKLYASATHVLYPRVEVEKWIQDRMLNAPSYTLTWLTPGGNPVFAAGAFLPPDDPKDSTKPLDGGRGGASPETRQDDAFVPVHSPFVRLIVERVEAPDGRSHVCVGWTSKGRTSGVWVTNQRVLRLGTNEMEKLFRALGRVLTDAEKSDEAAPS